MRGELAGEPDTTAMLDFGADSVDGWFAKLVAPELGIATCDLLDIGARELVVGSRQAPYPREFDTVRYLMQRKGSTVDREEVLAEVWGAESEVESNVVDVVIRSLRKKLDARANAIETVSGVGYRFRTVRTSSRRHLITVICDCWRASRALSRSNTPRGSSNRRWRRKS